VLRSIIARLGLAVISVVVTLAAAEVALRLLTVSPGDYRSLVLPDARFGHRLRPNAELTVSGVGGVYTTRFRTDSTGFRSRERGLGRTVILLGDSEVFGQGVDDDATLDAAIEHLIGGRVVNLGLPGIGTLAEEAILSEAGFPLSPTAVILFITPGNDLRDNINYGRMQPPRSKQRLALADRVRAGVQRLVIWAPTLAGFLPTDQIPQLAEQWYSGPWVDKGLPLMEGAIARMATNSRQVGVSFTVAVIPALPQFEPSHKAAMFAMLPDNIASSLRADPRRPQRLVESLCAHHGIRYIELLDEFSRLATEGVILKHPVDGHLNARGTAEIARIVASAL